MLRHPLPRRQAYDGFKHGIMRADFVRYLYMHHHGGLYADLDMECLKPMDTLMSTHMVVLARMGTNDSFSHSVPNAFMASVPGHPFWKFCIATSLMRWMVQLTLQEGVWYGPESITGPVVLKDAVDVYQEFHRENAPARGRLTILPAGASHRRAAPLSRSLPTRRCCSRESTRAVGWLNEPPASEAA